MTSVRIDSLVFDAGTQVRAAINEDVVATYAERMQAGDVFPAIVVFHDGSAYYIGDGFHRALAAKRNGRSELPADVRGGTKTDALWFALGANKTNGQRLTEADKRGAIEMAYATWPDKGQREIADQIGCSQRYVSTVREEIQVRTGSHLPDMVTGKDGKRYPASRGPNARSTEKREQVALLVKEGGIPSEIARKVGVSMTTVTDVRRSLGVPTLDKTKEGTAQRRQDIRDMAERGYTTRQIAAALAVDERTVWSIAKKDGIHIHADRAVGPTKRHDPNRIVEQMASDADNLTADVSLIEFADLDQSKIAGWLEQFEAARKSLSAFIRRLQKEQQPNEVPETHAQAV